MNEIIENSKFASLIKDKYVKIFINRIPLVSFIIAEILVLMIFNHFFQLGWLVLNIFVIGTILSLLLIKTNHFLKLNEQRVRTPTGSQKTSTDLGYKIGIWNIIVIFFKTLFFNLLNDLFILTIFWCCFFGILYFTKILVLPTTFNFSSFVGAMTLLGLFSGFFQFYVDRYEKEVSSKITALISQHIKKAIKDISFNDFFKFSEKNKDSQQNKDLHNRIRNIIFDRDKEKNIGRYKTQNLHIIHNLHFSLNSDPFALFRYVELYEEFEQKESTNSKNLHKLYEDYLHEKFEKFKVEFNKFNLGPIRRLIFSSIFFYDEVLTDLVKANFEMSEKDEEPKSFDEFYNNFIHDCLYHSLDKIINPD